mmetsp:Transcript_70506/g.111447  ORF Transcript_70506/g.111447 Transcript_70506/m.111447 type:complete len:251 (-) Transcript_70506:300-1052(-)
MCRRRGPGSVPNSFDTMCGRKEWKKAPTTGPGTVDTPADFSASPHQIQEWLCRLCLSAQKGSPQSEGSDHPEANLSPFAGRSLTSWSTTLANRWQQHLPVPGHKRHKLHCFAAKLGRDAARPWPTWLGRCIWKLWKRPAAHQPGLLRYLPASVVQGIDCTAQRCQEIWKSPLSMLRMLPNTFRRRTSDYLVASLLQPGFALLGIDPASHSRSHWWHSQNQAQGQFHPRAGQLRRILVWRGGASSRRVGKQ